MSRIREAFVVEYMGDPRWVWAWPSNGAQPYIVDLDDVPDLVETLQRIAADPSAYPAPPDPEEDYA